MFGYVRPLKSQLKMCDWDLYKSMYCGLCHRLKARCGFAARFTVSYDFAFLAIVLSDLNKETVSLCKKRCVASPFKKKCICIENKALDFAADACVILTYWKIMDEVCDSGVFKGFVARIGAFLLKRAYKKAAKRNCEFAELVEDCLKELKDIERKAISSLDAPADTFARILKGLADGAEAPVNKRIAEQIFYHLGRYIYLLDAWDDAEEDMRSKAYNPVLLRFEVDNIPLAEETKRELRETLAGSIGTIQSSFELIEKTCFSSLLENILYLGLPSMVKLVEDGKHNKKEKIINE